MNCPSLTDLCAANAAELLKPHLAGCPRCSAIVARVTTLDTPEEAPVPPANSTSGPPPRPGDVCTFWAPTSDEYVVGAVLDADEVEMLVVPLLMDPSIATAEDMVLPADALGYPVLAPVWAADHVLAEQMAEVVDVLSEQRLAELGAAYDAFYAGEPLAQPGGPPVLGDQDPRVNAHAAVADELGPVLGQRRTTLELDIDDLDVEPGPWSRFEAGKSDPCQEVSVRTIARVIRALRLVASRRIVQLAHASVLAHYQGEDVVPARALARRRRGIAPRPRSDPDAARQAADRYAAALAKELDL
jgi:hypothetical protein